MRASVSNLQSRETGPSLQPLVSLVAGDMDAVNSVILDRMQSKVPLIPQLAGHLVSGGGKRMRPMLTIGSALAVGYEGDRHHLLAAAVEFIHTATLLHDDVVDESGRRRGRATANIIWGNGPSVLVGDFLFSRAFELMVEGGSLEVLEILSRASAIISEGEVAQLTAQRNLTTREEDYLKVIDAKTAALFSAACEVAPVIAGTGKVQQTALRDYGRNLGIAFQLVDDAMDFTADSETMGKNSGDDFRDGKVTLPIILAYARGDGAARRFWEQAIAGRANGPDAFQEALAHIAETEAIPETMARAHAYRERATENLLMLPTSLAREALAETVAFAVDRAY